jgi:hypothetical protein
MKIKSLAYGMATFVPGVPKYRSKGTGGTDSARYCYSVWMRHLIMANKKGLNTWPKIIAELGPGDSLGIGLAGLISGSEKYYAFDIVEDAKPERNLKIFDDLLELFNGRSDVPGEDEFPRVKPYLGDYSFPEEIFDKHRLQHLFDNSRVEKIRNSIIDHQCDESVIQYKVPWCDANVILDETVDMIYSQAVLEHVEDLLSTYKSMYSWLKPNGYMSHVIDFKCHGTAKEWNGHWVYSDFLWKLMKGKRPYLLNREPYSKHVEFLNQYGLRLVGETKTKSKSNISKKNLSERFQSIPEDDLSTSDAFIQAIKY